MPDPPFPLSPLPNSPTSPSPKAANPRTFWRDIVRRVSRTSSAAPEIDLSTTHSTQSSITPLSTAQPPPTKLVEISIPNREQTDDIRRYANDPVNTSAFNDLPPAEVYDPAWNTNPLRCEAGRLGPQTSGPLTPVLPNAFTIKSSDLEDEDDDDTEETSGSHLSPMPTTSPSRPRPRRVPSSPPNSPSLVEEARETQRDLRPRRSIAWRKQNSVVMLAKSRSTIRKPTVFDSPTTLNATVENLQSVLRGCMGGEIVHAKACEIRVRVPIRSKDLNMNVVVVSIDERPHSCRVSVRRSFADSFRISSEDFESFCSELQKRFRELQQISKS